MKSRYFLVLLWLTGASATAQNVGIGTSSPQRQLHVSGSGELLRIQGSSPWIGLLNQSETDYSGFLYYPDTSIVVGTRAGTDKAVLLAPNNSAVLWASPLNGGRTGIGIAAPQNKLHIASVTSGDGLRITAPLPAIRLFENTDEKAFFKVTASALEAGSALLPVELRAGNTTAITIGTAATVGIGTVPLSFTKLHINGGANNEVLRISGADKPEISWFVNTDKAGSFEIGTVASSRFFDFKAESFAPMFRFMDAATGNAGVTVSPASGYVQIGNSTTAGTLDVNGATRLGGMASGAPAIRMKLLSGFMPGAGATLQYYHGLSLNQVIGVTVLCDGIFGNRKVPPGNNFTNNEYSYLVFSGNIEITTTASNSGNVLNRPVTICITYTD